jgi:hypothetical protein
MPDFSFIIPYLPFIGIVFGTCLGAFVPIFLMRLQAKKLKADISQIEQGISNAKVIAAKDQADALETLERIASSTAEELEKNLQKSITIRNLMEQIELQKTQLIQQQEIMKLQTANIDKFTSELAVERSERQTAVAEIENLKTYSDKVIQKLTLRVKKLEEYIESKGLPIPNGS